MKEPSQPPANKLRSKRKQHKRKSKPVQETAALTKSLLEPIKPAGQLHGRSKSARKGKTRGKQSRGLGFEKHETKKMKRKTKGKSSKTSKVAHSLKERKRLLVVGQHKMLGMCYAEKSSSFCELLGQFLSGSRRQIPSETGRRVSQNGEITTIDSDMEADPSSSARARLQGLMGLTLHSNDFSGFDDTTEVLVHHCPQPPVTNRLSECLQTTAKASPSTPELSAAMLPDIHKVGQEFHDRGNGTLGRNEISLPTPLNSPIKISNVQKSDDLKFQSKHEYYGDSLSKKRKRAIATSLGTFLINQTESARQDRLRLQILAHNAQRERLREMRQSRLDSALQKIALEEELTREQELQSRSIAKAEAEAAGLPAKLARQKRIAMEAWLAGEQKREKQERRNMKAAEEECRAVWEEMINIARRREKARQRELTQQRKRKRRVDKAIIAVLTYAHKMYTKQQAKLDPADAELRAIQAAEMKKMGRKQKALLDGWTTRKRLLAEAFAKLPFVCTPDTFFERMDLLLHFGHVERSFVEPKLDSNFGPLVSAVQGSPKMTYTGADFSHKLKIGAPFSVKGEVFSVTALRPNEIELDDQFSGSTGKYKALYMEEGLVERFRLVPEEQRPAPLSVMFKAVSDIGRCSGYVALSLFHVEEVGLALTLGAARDGVVEAHSVRFIREPKKALYKAHSMLMYAKTQPTLLPGDSVLLPTLGTCRAWVRYVGALHFAPGIWVGVELLDPARLEKRRDAVDKELHSGEVGGVTYFTPTYPKSCIFVRRSECLLTGRLAKHRRKLQKIELDADGQHCNNLHRASTMMGFMPTSVSRGKSTGDIDSFPLSKRSPGLVSEMAPDDIDSSLVLKGRRRSSSWDASNDVEDIIQRSDDEDLSVVTAIEESSDGIDFSMAGDIDREQEHIVKHNEESIELKEKRGIKPAHKEVVFEDNLDLDHLRDLVEGIREARDEALHHLEMTERTLSSERVKHAAELRAKDREIFFLKAMIRKNIHESLPLKIEKKKVDAQEDVAACDMIADGGDKHVNDCNGDVITADDSSLWHRRKSSLKMKGLGFEPPVLKFTEDEHKRDDECTPSTDSSEDGQTRDGHLKKPPMLLGTLVGDDGNSSTLPEDNIVSMGPMKITATVTDSTRNSRGSGGFLETGGFGIDEFGIVSTPKGSYKRSVSETAGNAAESELLRLGYLGRGAGGVVYKALHLPTLRICAVKCVSIHDEQHRDQLISELILSGMAEKRGARMPHLVELYQVFTSADSTKVSIVMEFMDSGSLEDVVLGGVSSKRKGLNISYLKSIARQCLGGLALLHRKKLLHRDIKPANILLKQDGQVKLADFGIAAQANISYTDLDNGENPAFTAFVGTMAYMAPERLKGSSTYSFPSDIWSLGLSLYVAATGNKPWAEGLTQFELISTIVEGPPPQLDSDVFPSDLCNFLALCLQMNPSNRPTALALLKHPFLKVDEAESMGIATDRLKTLDLG
eukprot:g1966.t1